VGLNMGSINPKVNLKMKYIGDVKISFLQGLYVDMALLG
jgi:hypothetical protein